MPTREQTVEVLTWVRAALDKRLGGASHSISILYGGSTKFENARAILDTNHVDGV